MVDRKLYDPGMSLQEKIDFAYSQLPGFRGLDLPVIIGSNPLLRGDNPYVDDKRISHDLGRYDTSDVTYISDLHYCDTYRSGWKAAVALLISNCATCIRYKVGDGVKYESKHKQLKFLRVNAHHEDGRQAFFQSEFYELRGFEYDGEGIKVTINDDSLKYMRLGVPFIEGEKGNKLEIGCRHNIRIKNEPRIISKLDLDELANQWSKLK